MNQAELNRMRELSRSVDADADRLEYIRARALRTTALLDGLPRGSGMRSALEESVAKLDEVRSRLEENLCELELLRNRFTEEALRLPAEESRVMMMRYLKQMSYEGIAREMHKSVSHIFRCHRLGLKGLLQKAEML